MKYILSAIMVFVLSSVSGQTLLVPGTASFEKKWIKNNKYEMTWYMLRDTAKIEIGTIATEVQTNNNTLTLITHVKLKRSDAPWVDSSIAETGSLKPIYHSSFNNQRDMVLRFGPVVTGYYDDKTKKTYSDINDATNTGYFDSNLYPYLISALPLADGYNKDIAIYDYNPSGKIGIMKASVKDVKSGTCQTASGATKNVWIVTVNDEIGGPETSSVYYFDKLDRKLWKQEVHVGARNMVMIAKE